MTNKKVELSDEAKCFNCGKNVNAEEEYCYGCGKHICSDCDVNLALAGPHNPEDHLEDPGFEGYDA